MSILFLNEPLLSPHEVDAKFNERRIALLPLVKAYISKHNKFENKDVKVAFSHKGISSLIAIIDAGAEKLVLKIPLSTSHSNGEALFMKAWEDIGVSVPHIFEAGVLGEHQYILMEYIDAPIASSVYGREELIENKIYFQMGKILRKMNTIPAEGYGLLVNSQPQFSNFVDWAHSPDMQTRYDYVKEHKILGDEHGSVDKAIEVLIKHTDTEKSTYCHNDFGISNTFATNPLTVFDPNPRFNNGYMDIACSIYNGLVQHYFAQEMIDGYFENEEFKPEVFHAAIMLTAYYKLPYAHKTKKEKAILYVQEYLLKNKHLLN